MQDKYIVRTTLAVILGVVGLAVGLAIPLGITAHLDSQQQTRQLQACAALRNSNAQLLCTGHVTQGGSSGN